MGSISIFYYLFFGLLLVIFVYLYRNQVYIYDKDYLNEMIEHHSMALLTSEEILQKTGNERVKRLAENGLAVILISHNLNDVFEVADSIAALHLGRMAAQIDKSKIAPQQVIELITTGKSESAGVK